MHIRSFHIDGFGLFSDLTVPNLSPGLNIFLGDNESGKSTCLDFFRVMLFGYPHHSSRELSRAPLRGGQAGGFLLLETLRRGVVRLTRRPGRGGLKLSDQNGKALDESLLGALMAGVTREMYRNVFAFSLSELQSFESLSVQGVRDALHGASFGTGLRSPAEILKQLDKRTSDIFTPQSRTRLLNKALAEWNEARAALNAGKEEAARFDSLSLRRDEQEDALRALRETQQTLRLERRDLERRLGVWRQWEEWRKADMALERLLPVPAAFPADGPARLERARERREAAARTVRGLEEQLARLRAEHEAIRPDTALLALLPELPPLAERKGSYRNAVGSLSVHKAALLRAEEELERLLGSLGPDWSCARIRTADRSLFAREEMERRAREMDVADQLRNAASARLQQANNEAERAGRDAERFDAEFERLPMPPAALDEQGRDSLRRILSNLEENRRRTPERMQSLSTARSDAARSRGPLRLKPDAPDDVLEQLLNAQEKAQEIAESVQTKLRAEEEARRAAESAKQDEEKAHAGLDRLLVMQRENRQPARTLLDGKSAALRKLRHTASSLTQEITRLAELDEQLGRPAPAPVKSSLLIGLGLLLVLLGFGALLARWRFGITSLALTPELAFPVTLWSGYLIVVAGVAFLAGGLPRSGPEHKRRQAEDLMLRERREGALRRVGELEEEAQRLCAEAGLGGPDAASPEALDAAETQLAREREELAAAEHRGREAEILQAEYEQLRERARRLEGERAQAANAVQQARLRWHNFLQDSHVETIFSPEAAAAFFAKAEAALLARNAADALERELRELVAQSAELEREARDLLPPQELPVEGADMDELLSAVRRALEACRDADACAEERAKAAAAAHNARLNLTRAEREQSESAAKLRETEEHLRAAREAWRGSLAELGLDAALSPGTVREALECMERCLNAEADIKRMRDELSRLEAERDSLALPVRTLLQRLDREPMAGSDNAPDWPASLDRLIRESAEAEQTARERALLESRIGEIEAALRDAEAGLEDEKRQERELLELAQARDAEEFLRHAAIREEREALLRRRQDLEDTLRLAAGSLPFEEFTASFASFDEEERKARLAALEGEIAEKEREERVLVDELGGLNAKLAALNAADEQLAALRGREAALHESMRRLILDYSTCALAARLIGSAKQNFERRSQPAVIRTASSIFADITDQAWTGISASLDAGTLSVLPPHGEAQAPEHLSRGTQEQLYLALRLAYIRNHAAHAAALPVIMDDILVNFDPERVRRTAAALLPLVRGFAPQNGGDALPPHQVLFFTCHPHQAEMLQSVVPNSLLHRVAGGKISMELPEGSR